MAADPYGIFLVAESRRMDDGLARQDVWGLVDALGFRLLALVQPGTASLALCLFDTWIAS